MRQHSVIHHTNFRQSVPEQHSGGLMAGGFAKDGAVQDQIDATIEDAVNRARSQISKGQSLSHCERCDVRIPEARRAAVTGVRLCITCQSELDKKQSASSGYNRRGSKDSQLR
jgi:phage/conjugal plasmid C-4 type zinc finger TraR family protein